MKTHGFVPALILATIGCSLAADQPAGSPLLEPRHALWSEKSPGTFAVNFETTKGDFVIQAHRDWAPRGVDRFYNLARARFFDDSRFFRVRAGFIVQFGIAGNPAIARRWEHEKLEDDPRKRSNTRGTLSYAMTGPNERTTQLFINLADNSRLDAEGFAPIGEVIAGMDVLERLYAGYGESTGGGMRGGKQGKIFAEGNAFLDREFPLLDKIIRASVASPLP